MWNALEVNLGAVEDKSLEAKLKFIAPKGNEEQGNAIQNRNRFIS